MNAYDIIRLFVLLVKEFNLPDISQSPSLKFIHIHISSYSKYCSRCMIISYNLWILLSFYRSVPATSSEIIQEKCFAHYSLEDVIVLKRLIDHTNHHDAIRVAAYITLNIDVAFFLHRNTVKYLMNTLRPLMEQVVYFFVKMFPICIQQ